MKRRRDRRRPQDGRGASILHILGLGLAISSWRVLANAVRHDRQYGRSRRCGYTIPRYALPSTSSARSKAPASRRRRRHGDLVIPSPSFWSWHTRRRDFSQGGMGTALYGWPVEDSIKAPEDIVHAPPEDGRDAPFVSDHSLQDELCFTPEELDRLQDNPRARMVSNRGLMKVLGPGSGGPATVSGFLLKDLGLSKSKVKSIILRHPYLLGTSALAAADAVGWLTEVLGLSIEEVGKVCMSFPQVFHLRADDNLLPTLEWLKSRVGVDLAGAAGVVLRYPPLLGLNAELNMEPKLRWLSETVGLGHARACKALSTNPNLLGYSVEDNLELTVAWLREELQLDGEGVARVVSSRPAVLGYSIEKNLRPTLAWLRGNLDLGREEAAKVFVAFPALFGYSIEKNLGPTLAFLREELGGSVDEVRRLVVPNPSVLGYSLTRRMQPRLQAIKDTGLEVVFSKHVFAVTKFTNPKFEAWIEEERLRKGGVGRSVGL
ncbi:unnamed protein product [Discosporangium mesarthrocarpum]